MIIIIIISLRQIAEENKNYTISFGALFKAGMIITLVTAIIMVVYFIIYANFIEPNFIDKILEVTKENLATKGLSEDQVDAALEMSKKFMSPTIMAVTSLISNLIIGAIAAAIGAGIFKNEK